MSPLKQEAEQSASKAVQTVSKTNAGVPRAAVSQPRLQLSAASPRDKYSIPCHRSSNTSWSCCVFANKIKKRVGGWVVRVIVSMVIIFSSLV